MLNRDISRCNNKECPIKMECKRHLQLHEDLKPTAKSGMITVATLDYNKEDESCDYLISIYEEK